MVFAVIFEVEPKASHFNTYLAMAQALRPQLEQMAGFEAITRYASLRRRGWILSLSDWASEKALVRWRTVAGHHAAQEKGRDAVLNEYHLRVGEVAADSTWAAEDVLPQQRLDETEVGAGKAALLVDGRLDEEWLKGREDKPEDVAAKLGIEVSKALELGALEWDAFEAVLSPGDVIFLGTWKDMQALEEFEKKLDGIEGVRRRRVRIVRDYGMFDRREAPQYYPDVIGKETKH